MIIFLTTSPSYEIQAFFYNLQFIINTTDYLIGIEYLKPFSENSARWTKALLIIYFCSIILVRSFIVKWKVFSGENNTSQILSLCLVGLKPDSLNFSVYIFKLFIILYNNSKLFVYYNPNKSSNKGA